MLLHIDADRLRHDAGRNLAVFAVDLLPCAPAVELDLRAGDEYHLVLLVEKLRVHLGEGNLHPGEMFGKKSLRGCREFGLRQGAAVLAGRRQTGGQQCDQRQDREFSHTFFSV